MSGTDDAPQMPAQEPAAVRELSQRQQDYRRLAIDTFGFDTQIGLTLALFHTFAPPAVASLLAHTGHVHSQADKRTVDTSLFVYELIHGGMEGSRGRGFIRKMNQLHGQWDIANEDYLFVLSVFVVTPIHWIDTCGWRPTTDAEKLTAASFYRRLGRLMGITQIPEDFEAFERYLQGYQEEHLEPSTASEELTAATLRVIAARLPRAMRPLAPELLSASLPPEVANCLGLPETSPRQRTLIRASLRATTRFTRPGTKAARPWFSPGGAVAGTYPQGYTLEDIGPQASTA